jgi:hypothetical protein
MNTMTELLMTQFHDTRVAERHAAADARRLAAEARSGQRTGRTWSLRGLFRVPAAHRSAPRAL